MNLTPRAPAAWVADVSREHQLHFELHASRRQISVAEYRRRALELLRSLCAKAELRLRLRNDHLPAVLAEGRIRNQFETGHSGGYFDPRARAELEHLVLGVPLEASASDRPIYGYLSGSDEQQVLPQYGTVIISLRAAVRKRATFTLGDSLDQTVHARIPTFAPSALEAPELLSLFAPQDVLDASSFAAAAPPSHRYAEAQIYGGISLADVARLEFTAGQLPASETLSELGRLALPWGQSQ